MHVNKTTRPGGHLCGLISVENLLRGREAVIYGFGGTGSQDDGGKISNRVSLREPFGVLVMISVSVLG